MNSISISRPMISGLIFFNLFLAFWLGTEGNLCLAITALFIRVVLFKTRDDKEHGGNNAADKQRK